MKYCINEATTMTSTFEDDVVAYSKAGFSAMELWLEKVEKFIEKNSLQAAKELLERNNIQAVCGCAAPRGIMLSKGDERKKAMDAFRRRLEICKTLGAKFMIAPSDAPEEVTLSTYDEAIPNLQEVSQVAEEYGISIALEFLRGNTFLGTLPTTIKLARKVNRKNVGVLFDTFHFYAGRSKLEDMDDLRAEELFFVHIDDAKDVPREIITDADRVYPGEGVFPLRRILDKIEAIGYSGYASLELFNRELWGKDPYEVAKKGLDVLKEWF